MNTKRRRYTRFAIVLSVGKTTVPYDKNTQFTTEQFVLCNFEHFFNAPSRDSMDNTTGPGRKRTREDQSDYYGGGKVVR
jgi:hypothetical protein